ncbi:hypothetical protein Hypma_009317 [Hypsizygus marmoreus]|uniref:Uncharacterized protein n=1 Tax=Hypsizygus marmoreus TaxID=39966 RepID=A0A369JTN1_HYPMA|nr:hypothetical protein Hypma_009317 [Hypsizygus marmoreus]
MLTLWRPSICTLYSSYSTFGLSRAHLGIHLSRCQRRYHFSDPLETVKLTTRRSKVKGRRRIFTLDASRLQDSDFIDLSPTPRNPRSQTPSIVSVPPTTQQTSSLPSALRSALYYHAHGIGSRFPENSHGFLYYHHDP